MATPSSCGSASNFGLNLDVQNYFKELQQWQKEKSQEMQLRKEAQRATINNSLNQVQELFEHPVLNVGLPCELAKSTIPAVVSTKKGQIEVKSTSRNTKQLTQGTLRESEAMKKVSAEDTPLKPCSQSSFHELVEQQMKKLMTNNKEEIKISNTTNQVKRPFLKKRSGLQKFTSTSISYPKEAVRKKKDKGTAALSSKNLKSKPRVCQNLANTASQKPQTQFVEFCLPKEKAQTVVASESKLPTPHFTSNNSIQSDKQNFHLKEKVAQFAEKEAKELTEYEVLEDLANHTSFTSDSSLLGDVLNAKDVGSGKQVLDEIHLPQISTHTAAVLENDCSMADPLTTDLMSLRQQQIELAKQLQKLDEGDSKNSVEPKEIFNMLSSSDDEDATTIPHTVETVPIASSMVNKIESSSSIAAAQALLREKIEEIEKEIQIYKTENAVLVKLAKCKEDELKSIQKDKEDFQKFKQAELDKLNKEITEKRHEIRREKQTFERYQKLRSSKKEREAMNELRRELELAREETKKNMVKFTGEAKRLRVLLAASAKKIEILENNLAESKKENENLKTIRQKKHVGLQSTSNLEMGEIQPLMEIKSKSNYSYADQRNNNVEVEHDKESTEEELLSEFSSLKDDVFFKDTNLAENTDEAEHHVRFNLDPEVWRFSPDSHSPDYSEIHHADRVERIYNTGEKEVVFASGNRKFISANELHIKHEYYNGDIEEIFPDKHRVYTYSDGVVEKIYPNGFRVVEFLNGRVEKYFPDGSKEIIDSTGKAICQRCNGVQTIRNEDGTGTTVFVNGTMLIEYPCGDKELRTTEFYRRRFSNGAVKTVYPTGRSETRLPNGRFRVKDKDGNVLFDSNTNL